MNGCDVCRIDRDTRVAGRRGETERTADCGQSQRRQTGSQYTERERDNSRRKVQEGAPRGTCDMWVPGCVHMAWHGSARSADCDPIGLRRSRSVSLGDSARRVCVRICSSIVDVVGRGGRALRPSARVV